MRKVFHGLPAATAALTLVPIGSADAVGTTAQARKIVHFMSPSENIHCYLVADKSLGQYANCLVLDDHWKKHKARPADCDLDWEPAEVTLTRKGKVNIGGCRGDIGSECLPDGGVDDCSALAYGKSVRAGNIRCASSRKGITCRTTDDRRHGFLVSRAGVKRL